MQEFDFIIYKSNNNYSFDLKAKNLSKTVFKSSRDYKFVPFIQPHYTYAWQAQKDALKLAQRKYHLRLSRSYVYNPPDLVQPDYIDISAEQMIINHYMNLISKMEIESKGLDNTDTERKDQLKQELKLIIEELQNVRDNIEKTEYVSKINSLIKGFKKIKTKYFSKVKSNVKMASILDDETIEELLYSYGEKICKAIQRYHNGAICFIDKNCDGGDITIKEVKNNSNSEKEYETIIKVKVNDKFNITNIMPFGKLCRIYPYHSVEFYQRYWKPIVDSIGHFYLDDFSVLLFASQCLLPDIPNENKSFVIKGWNVDQDKEQKISISFRGEKPIWIFEPVIKNVNKTANVQSKYTEQDYFNSIVKCIDRKLSSLYGRTGFVKQIIPLTDIIEMDIDFGRGLGIVRLTENQIEIVEL